MDEHSEQWTPEQLERAARVAKRLLGPPRVGAGKYILVKAADDLQVGDLVTVDIAGIARKCVGAGYPQGIAMASLTKGNYGWIQAKL